VATRTHIGQYFNATLGLLADDDESGAIFVLAGEAGSHVTQTAEKECACYRCDVDIDPVDLWLVDRELKLELEISY
jgi:hypothetical protein